MSDSCWPARRRLAEQLRQLPAEHCRQCQEELSCFIGDELAGLPVDRLYPKTAFHLDICISCLHEYEELVHLATASLYGDEEIA